MQQAKQLNLAPLRVAPGASPPVSRVFSRFIDDVGHLQLLRNTPHTKPLSAQRPRYPSQLSTPSQLTTALLAELGEDTPLFAPLFNLTSRPSQPQNGHTKSGVQRGWLHDLGWPLEDPARWSIARLVERQACGTPIGELGSAQRWGGRGVCRRSGSRTRPADGSR